jgi:hypothetical protein
MNKPNKKPATSRLQASAGSKFGVLFDPEYGVMSSETSGSLQTTERYNPEDPYSA